MRRPMKMTPFLIKLLKEKQTKNRTKALKKAEQFKLSTAYYDGEIEL